MTFTDASVPSVTVISTGLVKSAFSVPSAGVTVIVGCFAEACADAADFASSEAEDASAAPPPCSDGFDRCGTPTARLPEFCCGTRASCRYFLG
ncbi:hypothetical protein [Streptomyces regalis]|uniref:hypothetical protein n=1 Tax=Streptomyces regalis TaxID=68262 RepID=UPI001FC9018D|nr:hypothetical protein [Streptomyces regalis]